MKKKLYPLVLLVLNIVIVTFAFLLVAKFRDGTRRILGDFRWWSSLIAFTAIWIVGGLWGGKYSLKKILKGAELVKRIIGSDLFAAAVVFGLMYVFKLFHYSRTIVIGTMLGSVVLEVFIFVGVYYAFLFRSVNKEFATASLVTRSAALEQLQSPDHFLDRPKSIPVISNDCYQPPYEACDPGESVLVPLCQDYLRDRGDLFSFINDYLELSHFSRAKSLVIDTEAYVRIMNLAPGSLQLLVNLHRVNDLRRINLYLIKANEILEQGGVFVCNGQTITERRSRFNKRFTPVLGAPLYFGDFLLRRVMPKLPIVQGWYFALTKGRNRALSETEMLGRFYFCGFELINKKQIHGSTYFILKKITAPRTDPHPTYGPLIRLKRLGRDGKVIYIKKLRTMHPYSEYLQDYVFQTNALQEGGKFRDDFRVTSWGRIMRALWIDELPQLLNFLKGELALVGVRALSEHYFSLYPQDVQELRQRVKPGLLPPFYADMPETFDEIVDSERRYILSKLKKPFRTDCRYFIKGLWNILVKRARSN